MATPVSRLVLVLVLVVLVAVPSLPWWIPGVEIIGADSRQSLEVARTVVEDREAARIPTGPC